jgi:hypothetical protein
VSDCTGGAAISVADAVGRTLIATVTASVAKLTTRNAIALPINTTR